jgi:phosphoribosylformylglycinamidine cyclo-ligase
MPGVYALGDYDLVGFAVGVVPADLARPRVVAGDLLVGLASSGLHTNGYSLVRHVFEAVPLGHVFPELGRPLEDELLEPHRCYLEELRQLPWKAAAHVTGGGLLGNLHRALPAGLAAELDRSTWAEPPIFGLISRLGRVADEEMLGTFNMGLGMVLVTPEPLPGFPVVGRVVDQTGAQRVRVR